MSFIDENARVENRFKTIEEIKAVFLKQEISFDGAWENLCRFFDLKPYNANELVHLWKR